MFAGAVLLPAMLLLLIGVPAILYSLHRGFTGTAFIVGMQVLMQFTQAWATASGRPAGADADRPAAGSAIGGNGQ